MKNLALIIILTASVLFISNPISAANNNPTGIEDEFVSFNLYPNPSNGYFSIKMKNDSPYNITIYALNGALVYNQKNVQNQTLILDISKLVSKGMYHVRISQGENATIKRLVIK